MVGFPLAVYVPLYYNCPVRRVQLTILHGNSILSYHAGVVELADSTDLGSCASADTNISGKNQQTFGITGFLDIFALDLFPLIFSCSLLSSPLLWSIPNFGVDF